MLRSLNEGVEGEREKKKHAPRSLRAAKEDGGSLGVVERTKWGKEPAVQWPRALVIEADNARALLSQESPLVSASVRPPRTEEKAS
ncbi:hypothetical protein HRbin08_00936 [bacterium HR08]|nr:hypothetical protein HRbin08_00936 [bacterium HR08]